MKKIIIMIGLILIMAGCSKGGNFTTEIGKKVLDNELEGMEEIASSTLTDAYNLELNDMQEYLFKQNTAGDFYAIIKTENPTEVKKQMNNYFERVKDFNSSYSPERLEILNERLEKQLDQYLIYIVASNADEIYEKILDEID